MHYSKNLWSEFVSFPETVDQTLIAVSQMENKWKFPSALGGVDSCHIPIKFPRGRSEGRKENYNFKSFCSLVMTGMIGADYKILWTTIGLPGSFSDHVLFGLFVYIKI